MRTNPFTGEPLKEFSPSHPEDLLKSLRERQAEWRRTPVAQRCQMLLGALNHFEENREEVARGITEEMGRPLTQARREIDGLLERARYLAEIAPRTLAPEHPEEKLGFERTIRHEPLGVVFVISAWNYPLLITINGVMASLLAGNTVLLKHATQTLGTGEHFARAFGPLGLLAHAVMDHSTAGRLLQERQVDHVIFTGSVEGGRVIYEHAARGLLDCQLELGGKDGAYVAEDVDPEEAAESLVDGAMFNSGQSCCGIERVYVHTSCHDAFVAKCKTLLAEYVLGDPMDPKTTLGPLARAGHERVLEDQVADAVAKGARLEAGGRARRIGEGTFFEPTLLTGVTHEMEVMREENFGPILPVMKVESDAEALVMINDSSYGLTSAIFTKSADRAEDFAEGARTGTVFRNRCDYLDPALPWTGVKDSGIGSALSPYGLLGVTRRKACHFKCSS